MKNAGTIWTIGHSTHSLETFVDMLKSFDIELLADVRNYPGSRKFPQFNKDALEFSMPDAGIGYMHLKSLGGRRKPQPGSRNTAWRSDAFRGYADYMDSPEFQEGLAELITAAGMQHTAYMCSEAVWWRCHRALISDVLKNNGWTVMHIMAIDKATEHPFSSAATVADGVLSYEAK